jgi:hypothetical protein
LLLPDGQVHHDTHVIPMGNYVIGVGNYVIATPSEPGNYMSADMPHTCHTRRASVVSSGNSQPLCRDSQHQQRR